MYNKTDVNQIKTCLEKFVGNKVTLTSGKGRKKSVVRYGIIESTYNSIFVVKLDVNDYQIPSDRRVSYNYIDVLTNAIEIILVDEGVSILSA